MVQSFIQKQNKKKNMAFNMKPGRSPFQQTGHGLPSVLLQKLTGGTKRIRTVEVNKVTGNKTKEEALAEANKIANQNLQKDLTNKPLGDSKDIRNASGSATYTIPGQKVTELVKPGTPEYKKWLAAVKNNPGIEDKFKDKTFTETVNVSTAGKDKPSMIPPPTTPKLKPADKDEWYAEHSEGSANYMGNGSYGLSFDPEERRIKDLNYKVDQNASKDPNNPNRIALGKNNYQHRPLTDQEKRIMNDDRYANHEINPYIAKWQGEGGEAKRQSLMNAITSKMDERDAKQKEILTKRSESQKQKSEAKATKDKATLETMASKKAELEAKRQAAIAAIKAKRQGNTTAVASATPQLKSQNKKSPNKQLKSKSKTPAKMKKC